MLPNFTVQAGALLVSVNGKQLHGTTGFRGGEQVEGWESKHRDLDCPEWSHQSMNIYVGE